MLRRIKDNFRKAQAAVIIQNLLTEAKNAHIFGRDPALVANAIVGKYWDGNVDFIERSAREYGAYPKKQSIASAALEETIRLNDDWGSDQTAITTAFMRLADYLISSSVSEQYKLTVTDHLITDKTLETFGNLFEQINYFSDKNDWEAVKKLVAASNEKIGWLIANP